MEASKKLVMIKVDCTESGAHSELMEQYEVSGFPTVVFTDPEGTKVGELGGHDAESVSSQFAELASGHSR